MTDVGLPYVERRLRDSTSPFAEKKAPPEESEVCFLAGLAEVQAQDLLDAVGLLALLVHRGCTSQLLQVLGALPDLTRAIPHQSTRRLLLQYPVDSILVGTVGAVAEDGVMHSVRAIVADTGTDGAYGDLEGMDNGMDIPEHMGLDFVVSDHPPIRGLDPQGVTRFSNERSQTPQRLLL